MSVQTAAPSELTAELHPFRILIVEDNPAEAELIFERLSDACPGGFDISHAPDIARAPCERVDCIVLDLQLPDTTGADTIKAMRARCPDAAIIAYSGMDNEASRYAALEAGAQYFISKNDAHSQLLDRCIRLALQHWGAFAPWSA